MPDFNHPSGLLDAYLRANQKPTAARSVPRDGKFLTSADLNDALFIAERRNRRTANLVAKDGDRIEGADISIDRDASTASMTAGLIYINGDVKSIEAANDIAVNIVGDYRVGVRLNKTVVTEVEDPSLVGLHPGSKSEGEACAAIEVETIIWATQDDGGEGEFYAVYLLIDGTVIDQTPPPALTGITQAISSYDYNAHGNYIVKGCHVTALGPIDGAQHFSIEKGTANIEGFARSRQADLRHIEIEQPETEQVDGEPHTFTNGGAGDATIDVYHAPIDTVLACTVEKQVTRTITKGVTDSFDALPDNSITEIVAIVQGGTTYTSPADYSLDADQVSWIAAGSEPAPSSTYDITYKYLDSVVPVSYSDSQVVLAGGVENGTVTIQYTYKMPRIDLLCLDREGRSEYVKGLSSLDIAYPPQSPKSLLKLAEIHNNWMEKPKVVNNGTPAFENDKLLKMLNKIIGLLDLVGLERLHRALNTNEPAAKQGVFVDPFENDRYRDANQPQTLAAFLGSLELAVDPTIHTFNQHFPITLDYTPEVVVSQPLKTACTLINEYINALPMPKSLELTPAVDFWVEHQTQFLSDQTREITGSTPRSVTTEEIVDRREESIAHLRQINVAFKIEGFGNGENLTELTFDGLDVNPGGLSGNALGEVNSTFTIPANVVAGLKSVVAKGAGGSLAEAAFMGQGTIETDVIQRLTTTTRVPPAQTIGIDVNNWSDFDGFGGPGNGTDADPQAQSFALIEPRMVMAVDCEFCQKGDPSKGVLVQLVNMRDGDPTTEVHTEDYVNMATTVLNEWTRAEFKLPIYLTANRLYASVFKTDDDLHSIAIANIGEYDADKQQTVSRQAYNVGNRHSASNARSWTHHQKSDVKFQIVAAKFGPLTKTIELGTKSVTNMSDILIRASVLTPTAQTRCWFEVELVGINKTHKLEPNTNLELNTAYSGDVIVRAVLSGTEKVAPILYPGIRLIEGRIRSNGTYVSRAFDIGSAANLFGFIKTKLPSGSTLSVEVDAVDGNWQAMTEVSSALINEGWTEKKFAKNPYTANPKGRLKITLTGGPNARPALTDLRAASI